MSWQLNNLKYGWMILASITLGTTIYIINNQRQRVRPEDIVELVLGATERCLATQYQTNPPAYYVSPPSFVRSWYSNSYETTNVPGDLVTNWIAVLHTNIFTNVFGARLDRAMMVSLDTTIKALIPYYADTNTVYDGTTNIVMLTVTGLWASLGIGDGTNQFTRVPEWIGTNGTTNAATYGDYPWRIYKEDLEERYKVLEALKMTKVSVAIETQGKDSWWDGGSYWTSWTNACALNESWFSTSPSDFSFFRQIAYGGARLDTYVAHIVASRSRVNVNIFSTNLSIKQTFSLVYPFPVTFNGIGSGDTVPYTNNIFTFDDNGLGIEYGKWNVISSGTNDYFGSLNLPNKVDQPPSIETATTRGFAYNFQSIVNWNFQYCANAYWE